MKKMIMKTTIMSLLAAAIVAMPALSHAQDASTNTPAAKAEPQKDRKHDHSVFNGKLTAVDKDAMTLTVGKRTFEITSETKITKNGEPATLADGVVGELAAGAYKKGEDGKLTATSVRFGAKADGQKQKKKKVKTESSGSSTNSTAN